ncbi:DEKNAAC102077 [Brettanomyces naardenensis]|uniref:DEKNAAC102077 n=1 Tax=Brettanomyces naardenensis TaxID=13370 RepID=A0A448YJN5_BRENA|nr:DEKNAAC102077 [Brettanomyces naardenensis]
MPDTADQKEEGNGSSDPKSVPIARSDSSVSISQMLLHPFTGRDRRFSTSGKKRYSVSSYQQRHDNSEDINMIPVAVKRETTREVATFGVATANYKETGDDEDDATINAVDKAASDATANDNNGTATTENVRTTSDDGTVPLQRELTLKEYRNEVMKQRGEGAENEDETVVTGTGEGGWFSWGWGRRQDNTETVERIEEDQVTDETPADDHDENQTNKSRGFWGWIRPSAVITEEVPIIGAEELEPNKLSKVISSVGVEEQQEETERSWWPRWGWGSPSTGNDENESSEGTLTSSIHDVEHQLRESAKEAEKILKVKTSSYSWPSSWAFYTNSNEELGQLSIMGSKSLKEPLLLKQNVSSQFAVDEQAKFALNEVALEDSVKIDSSVVIPKLDWNYRDLTLRTQLRIFLSSMGGPITKVAPGESHLYHDSAYDERPKNRLHKKAVIIGVHSFLPMQLVESFIGESTGTADQLTDMTRKQLVKWGEEHNTEWDIETVSLDGYGQIFDRVSNCLSLLENWTGAMSDSDVVLVVSSLQSVAISVHILSRLATAGYLDNVSKAGMINIGGPCLGPTVGLDSKLTVKSSSGSLENDILLELFDFQDSETLQSRELVRHLKILIGRNVKICFIGSMTDSLTPLYSSLCLQISHPNIYRAIYIDGGSDQPDFLVTLLNLALTVKNLNLNDHRLLVELSNFFMENADRRKKKGHQNQFIGGSVYEDGNVYGIGIENLLETHDLIFAQAVEEEEDFHVKEFNMNEYHMPWCMRGFIEELGKLKEKEDRRRDRSFAVDTGQMIDQLLEEFKAWEPKEKEYKELRYCIEAMGEMKREDVAN